MVRRLEEQEWIYDSDYSLYDLDNLPDNERDVFNFVNNSSERISNKTLAKQVMRKFGWSYDMIRNYLYRTFAVTDLPPQRPW